MSGTVSGEMDEARNYLLKKRGKQPVWLSKVMQYHIQPAARRINAPPPVNYAALGAATESVFFFMQTARKNDIGMMGSFGEKEIDNAEILQLRQRFAGEIRVG